MAKIPQFDQQREILSRRPDMPNATIDPGMMGNAISGAGQQVFKLGAELMQRQKKAEDDDFVFSQTAKDERDFAEFRLEADKNKAPDGSGYTKGIQEWGENRLKENLKVAPSSEAAKQYEMRMGAAFNHATVQAMGEEQKTKIAHWQGKIVGEISLDGNSLVSAPNLATAYRLRDNSLLRIKAASGNLLST